MYFIINRLTFSLLLRNVDNFVLKREIVSDFTKLSLFNDMGKKLKIEKRE